MDCLEILNRIEIADIIEELGDNSLNKETYEFNIFSVSTSGNQLENFHSDIIGELLNPNGLYQEGDKLLYLFFSYLAKSGEIKNIVNFNNYFVFTETARI